MRQCACFYCFQQLQAEVELAWSRAGAVSTVQRQLDSAFAQLQSQVQVDHRNVDSLAAAVALLCGAIYPLSIRASELATQRHLLAEQLQRFDAFKQQAKLLIQHFCVPHELALICELSIIVIVVIC